MVHCNPTWCSFLPCIAFLQQCVKVLGYHREGSKSLHPPAHMGIENKMNNSPNHFHCSFLSSSHVKQCTYVKTSSPVLSSSTWQSKLDRAGFPLWMNNMCSFAQFSLLQPPYHFVWGGGLWGSPSSQGTIMEIGSCRYSVLSAFCLFLLDFNPQVSKITLMSPLGNYFLLSLEMIYHRENTCPLLYIAKTWACEVNLPSDKILVELMKPLYCHLLLKNVHFFLVIMRGSSTQIGK